MIKSQGLVVSSYGRQFIVEVAGANYQAVTKSKKTEYVVGDQVWVQPINQQQVQITELLPRRNLVYRSDHNRSKIIASNIDQLLIVIAIKPNFNIHFLNSCLISAEAEGITPIIVINKIDLAKSNTFANEIIGLYQVKLGYKVVKLSALTDCKELTNLLTGQNNLLIGQSGVGKSTITNQLIPHAKTRTGAITKAETSGAHTTTNATLYHLDATSQLIDCPGLQEFGLYHLELTSLASLFPELRQYLGECKFRNCRHINEPNCALVMAHQRGQLDSRRFELLQNLTQKLQQKTCY
jgi:ribosome biogenesis GTPase